MDPGSPQPDDTTVVADGNLSTADDVAPSPGDCSSKTSCVTKTSQKQRARRSMKRASKREANQAPETSKDTAASFSTGSQPAETSGDVDRCHRPSSSERSMIFFLKNHEWAQLFVENQSWPAYARGRGTLGQETVGRKSGSGRVFRDTAGLERFIMAKTSEAAYIEKQLRLMPQLQDPVCGSHFQKLQEGLLLDGGPNVASSPERLEDKLEGPADFLQETILPCLMAQVESLRQRLVLVQKLQRKFYQLQEKCQRQEEIRHKLDSLRQDQLSLLPIRPVWRDTC
ncbi:hypothetical protein GQ53DRAFT_802759 [Thozetella sp. PMI_491]|nr:hypothetical protein GQ53DRAFT_802759 [Thozetella sp. PMI_491]